MRKSILLPGLAVAGGAVGFLLRKWQLTAGFEADTALPIPFAPSMLALIAWSVVLAAVFIVLCRGKHQRFEGGYDKAFGAKGNTLYITVMVLSAFLLLAAGGISAMNLGAEYQTALSTEGVNPIISIVPKALLVLLAVYSFVCVLTLGKNSYRGEGKGKYSGALLAPGYLCAIWLISAYQTRAGDPIRQDYIYELFAIMAALLAIYFIAGYSFEKGKFTRTVLFSLMAIYLCMVTLADGHSLGYLLLYGAMILYLAAQVTALLFNDAPRMCPTRTESATETEIETEETTDEG